MKKLQIATATLLVLFVCTSMALANEQNCMKKATGGGAIPSNCTPTKLATFGFSAINKNCDVKGEMEFHDKGCNIDFHGKVKEITCYPINIANICGVGTLKDGTQVSAIFKVTDNGKSGKCDTIEITLQKDKQLPPFYYNKNILVNGNIQVKC